METKARDIAKKLEMNTIYDIDENQDYSSRPNNKESERDL